MLIYRIQQEMVLGDRAQRKMLVIDEAWELLGEGEVARFIEGAYRRFRKYNGLVATITQDLGDLYLSPVGEAITANSANTILLRQKGDVIDRLVAAKHVTLSPYEVQLVKSLRTVSGGGPGRPAFSEAYLMTERGRGVGRLIVPAPGAQALEARLMAAGQAPRGLADTAERPDEDLDALGRRLLDALDAGAGEGGS